MHALDDVLALLAEHGYEPRVEGAEIVLANCPFHALARDHTALVCGMNLHLLTALLELLAPDATLWADGGGKAKAPLRPIRGADKIARFFAAIGAEPLPPGSTVEVVEVNGGPAAVLVGPAGAIAVLQLDLGDDHRVVDLRLVGNPDKLTGLAALRSVTR